MSDKKRATFDLAKQFRAGDRVTWESQAAGSSTSKAGVVVYVREASFEDCQVMWHSAACGADTVAAREAMGKFSAGQARFDSLSSALARLDGGVIVRVDRGTAAPHFYAPRTRSLRRAEA